MPPGRLLAVCTVYIGVTRELTHVHDIIRRRHVCVWAHLEPAGI